MKAEKIIIVSGTHWDREWYLTFQEYRAELVLMMNNLLEILKENQNFRNFTLDGQTIALEDYLEVRPEKKSMIMKYVKEGRLSIGPMYTLPDEFLVSGESIIRNFYFGIRDARNMGRSMNAGYFADNFGHIAQLPQIINGFELSSAIFWRGFGDEFEENNLDMEFIWNAPGNSGSVIGIHLLLTYFSLLDVNFNPKNGKYIRAIKQINKKINKMEAMTASSTLLLISSFDHQGPVADLPNVIEQWNEENKDIKIELADFEHYLKEIDKHDLNLKSYKGEMRGAKYAPVLTGNLSARMWIKQRNRAIENLFEKYIEPITTFTWLIDKYHKFEYPQAYLEKGLKWLLKNHPHDSINGTSIDQVHQEMRTRFDWAEQIGMELFKNAFIYLTDLIEFDNLLKNEYLLIIYNPLPWRRTDIISFDITLPKTDKNEDGFKNLVIRDYRNEEINYQQFQIDENPRYHFIYPSICHRFIFLDEIPSCGYKTYRLSLNTSPLTNDTTNRDFLLEGNKMENQFFKLIVNNNGTINAIDKESGITFENICNLEDCGEWGDIFDFSGPLENQKDSLFTSENASNLKITTLLDGPIQKTIKISMIMKLPVSLSEDRTKRNDKLIDNIIDIYVSLYNNIKRIDLRIELENNCKDHRIRVVFPTQIKSKEVFVEDNFYIIKRKIELPKGDRWAQPPSPMYPQNDFIALTDGINSIAILNKGLKEYEAIKNDDGTISLAITLLRCTEWLSRRGFAQRSVIAGPELNIPDAQCLGKFSFELSFTTEPWHNTQALSIINLRGKEFNNPLKSIFPQMIHHPLRTLNTLISTQSGYPSFSEKPYKSSIVPYLPREFSFLEIDNKNIILSVLKKAYCSDDLIIRVYNITSKIQQAIIKLNDFCKLKNAKIVNLLEEDPINPIKAKIENFNTHILSISLEPNVIATIKLEIEKEF